MDSAPPRFDRETFARGFVGAILDFTKAHLRKLPSLSSHKPSSANNSAVSATPRYADTLLLGLSSLLTLCRYTHPVLTPLANAFFATLLSFPFLRRTFDDAHASLLQIQPSKVPQLFIYSKADQLIPWYDVEYYIQMFMDAGFDIKKVKKALYSTFTLFLLTLNSFFVFNFFYQYCFQDSPHVSHLLYHPDQYTELVRKFTASVLFIKMQT